MSQVEEYREILIKVKLILLEAQRAENGERNGMICNALSEIDSMSEMREHDFEGE